MIDNEKSITPAELKVLEILWEKSPLSASDIVAKLKNNEVWHSRTVKSLINRLAKKNYISFVQEGNRYLYSPLINRNEYQQTVSQTFIQRVFGGKLSSLVAHFAQREQLSQDDINELKAILETL